MRIATVSRTKPITQKGISFDSRNRDLGTGETFICSIVLSPSRSRYSRRRSIPRYRQQEYHDAGNHIDLVTQVGIEQVNRSHSPARSHRGETFLPIEILYNRGEVGATQAALSSVHALAAIITPALPSLPKSRSKSEGISRMISDSLLSTEVSASS